MRPPGWPARLSDGRVALRPPRRRDAPAWVRARAGAEDWLRPWEASAPELASSPWAARQTISAFLALRRAARQAAREGSALPFVITRDGTLAGMISVGEITRGAAHCGALGYWVDEGVAGRGIGTAAVALLVDHCFDTVGLHRLEAWVRPENDASRRLLARVGFHEEGVARTSLWVDGAWRDHIVFALCAAERIGSGGRSMDETGAVQRIRGERRSVG